MKKLYENQKLRGFISTLFIAISLGIMFFHCVGAALGGKSIVDPVAAACATGCLLIYIVVEELANSAEEQREREYLRQTEHEQLLKDIEIFDKNDYYEKTGRRI